MDEDVGAGVDPSERAQDAGGGGSTPERRRRMSARRKQDAVLRLLRGEDLELLSGCVARLVGNERHGSRWSWLVGSGSEVKLGRGLGEALPAVDLAQGDLA